MKFPPEYRIITATMILASFLAALLLFTDVGKPKSTLAAMANSLTLPSLNHKRHDSPSIPPSPPRIIIAPTAAIQNTTSTVATHLANATTPSPERNDTVARHAKRAVFPLYPPLYLSHTSDTDNQSCSGKPYTRTLHFMLAHPNGTLLNDGLLDTSPIFYIWTRWVLSYPDSLLSAILDDPTTSPSCPKGHCYSSPIRDIGGLRLTQTLDAADDAFWCLHARQHGVSRLSVQLGKTSYLYGRDLPSDEVGSIALYTEHYMASRMKTTYPVLEIGLILGFTLGVFMVLPVVAYLGFLLCCAVAVAAVWVGSLVVRCCKGVKSRVDATGAACKRRCGDIKMRGRGRGVPVVERRDTDVELKDLGSAPLPTYDAAVRSQGWDEGWRMV